MKYSLQSIMSRAWEIKRDRGERITIGTALRLAWAEAKGQKVYTFNLEAARAQISSYLVKLTREERDEHGDHKLAALRAALMAKVDRLGIAVLDGKSVGLCKYAQRNA